MKQLEMKGTMMLQKITDLPTGVIGVEAHGKITKDDYHAVLTPMLSKAYAEGSKIKFLYHFTPDFTGFSAGAAWNDFTVGLRYLRLFERCAIVTDVDWLAKSSEFARFLMPCPVQVFKNAELSSAVEWLSTALLERGIEAKLLREKGVLVVEPKRALDPADFEYLASIVDPWIEQHGNLNGLVLHAKKFPGWENLGGLVHHIQFVKEHHKQVKRIATATESGMMDLLPKIGAHFVDAEVKGFGYQDIDAAIAWASKP